MTKKTFYALFFFLLALQVSYAQQYPSDGQYQGIAPPNTPALPDYGQSITDNTVPTHIKMTRVTEYQAQWEWYPFHEYSKTQVWNIDQTRYKVASWKVYNATTYVEEREFSSMYPCYWSNTDPDIVWSFRENGAIKKYNVSTDVTEIVANIPGYEVIKLGPGEGNIDKNDHYVALVGKKANGATNDLDVIVFDLQTNQITKTITFAGAWDDGTDYAPKYIDWVSVSQSGNYVVVLWANAWNETAGYYTDQNNVDHYGLEVYDRANMQYQRRIDDSAGHGDLGYAVDGAEVFVQFKTGVSGIYMYKLNGQGGEITISTNSDFFATGHVSCRNINRPGWAYITQTKDDSKGQIVAVKLDNSGIVEHFGHHFSSDNSYDKAPMAVASPNGDKVCFKSDFGTAPNINDAAYDFIAEIANPLAVEWVERLEAFQQKNTVSLRWTVAQQINNEKFEIERSADGIHFEPIESRKADGNLAVRKEFKAIDTQPLKGYNYYRIKQIYYDGQFDYSNIASVYFDRNEISIYPNPAHNEIHIASQKDVLRRINVYNHIGQLVQSLTQKSNVVNIKSLPHGVYWVRITEDAQTSTIKLVKE